MNRRKIFTASFVLFCASNLFAQEAGVTALSLKECITQAVEKNINAVKARIDREKSGHKTDETRSALLPQISIAGSFQDNLKLPTTLINGDALGRPGLLPMQMGVQYTSSAAISLNQSLYNRTALTALKIAKQAEEISRLGVEKASETLAQEVAKLYFLAQTTAKQESLIEENIRRVQNLTGITKVLLDNGMIKQVDYDRINVNMQNLLTQRDNTDALHEQQLNMLKYMLEIPAAENIVLTDTVNLPLLNRKPLPASGFSSHVDIRLLESQKELARLNHKNAVNAYFNNRQNVERQLQNIALAQKVYDETALKYREGLSTMSALLQDEMNLSSAQANYLNALYNFKDAELQIMSLNGEIKSLIINNE